MKKERLYYLDFARVICMILVLVYHLFTCINQWTPLQFELPLYLSNGVTIGEIAVPVFFMLSGASLYYSYGGAKFNVKEYYKKRFMGIYPMFWITWLVFYLLYFFMITYNVDGEIPRWTFFLTVLGVDHYFTALTGIKTFALVSEWFLGCILLIYMLYPIIKYAIEKYPKITASCIVIVYLLNVLYANNILNWEGFNPLIRLTEFVIGIYFIKYRDAFTIKVKYMCCGLFIIMCFIPSNLINSRIFYDVYDFAFMIFLFVIWKVLECNLLKRIISTVVKYSYTIFLNHHVIMYLVFLSYLKKNPPMDNGYSSMSNVLCLVLIIVTLIVFFSYELFKLENSMMNCVKSINKQDLKSKD